MSELAKAHAEIERLNRIINSGDTLRDHAIRKAMRERDEALARLSDIESQNRMMWDVANDREARLAEAERDSQRLDWLERHLFEGRWDGTIGRPKSWHMAGPYRHTLQRMRGDALREAIDLAMRADSATHRENEHA